MAAGTIIPVEHIPPHPSTTHENGLPPPVRARRGVTSGRDFENDGTVSHILQSTLATQNVKLQTAFRTNFGLAIHCVISSYALLVGAVKMRSTRSQPGTWHKFSQYVRQVSR